MHALLRPGAAVAASLTVLLLGSAGASAAGPPTAPARSTVATGDFSVAVDLSTAQARDLRGNRCELTVGGTLTFTGTVVGTADGTTTAVISAPCSQALTTPPGTYADRFRFDGQFTGEVADVLVSGPVVYRGVTRAGGEVDATVLLDGDRARAVLRADAVVGVGGSYQGVAGPG